MLVRTALPVLIWLLVTACSRVPQDPVVLTGHTMGTTWAVRLAEPPGQPSVSELRAEIEDLLEQVNDEMSTWREDSAISRFNRLSAGDEMVVPEGFASVLDTAMQVAVLSDGAYDPTVGPLVNLWGFGPPHRHDAIPEPEAIADTLEKVGHSRLAFDRDQRRLVQPGGLYLDFSSIAKGWGVDVVAERLLAHGIDNFLVDIGGDIRSHGQRLDGPWRIAIERPVPGTRDIHQIIEPGTAAIVTSGTYRQFFEADGQRFSHTIDPRTGYPVDHHAVSITVIGDNATWADAWATALGVPEPERAYEMAVKNDIAALWILEINNELVERYTQAFAPYLTQELN